MPLFFREGSAGKEFSEAAAARAKEEGKFESCFYTEHPGKDMRFIRSWLEENEMKIVLSCQAEKIPAFTDLEEYIDENFELQLGDSKMLQSINFNHHESMQVPIERELDDTLGFLKNKRKSENPDALEDFILGSVQSVPALLQQLAEKKKISHLQLAKDANLDPCILFSVFNGNKRKLTKEELLALAIGLHLSLHETEALLKKGGFAFSSSSLPDLITAYFLKEQEYSIDSLNLLLFSRGLKQLGI